MDNDVYYVQSYIQIKQVCQRFLHFIKGAGYYQGAKVRNTMLQILGVKKNLIILKGLTWVGDFIGSKKCLLSLFLLPKT